MVVYVLSKLFTYIFLPPGLLVIVLFLAGFFAKRLKWLFYICAIFVWFISTTPGKDIIVGPLEKIKVDNKTASAVVVLSGGVNPSDKIKAYPDAFKREVYGFMLACRFDVPLVISGGGLKISESKNILKDIELIESISNCKPKIILEDRSLNTYQNAKYTSAVFVRSKLPKNIYLVTSAYHMKRAIKLFKYFGFKIHPYPVGFFKEGHYNFFDYLPKMGNFYKSYKAIHEYFGILSLKLFKIG